LKEQIELGECISSLDFSPTGDYIAVGLIDETIKVWYEKNKQKYRTHKQFFSNNNSLYIFNTPNQTGRLISQRKYPSKSSLNLMAT